MPSIPRDLQSAIIDLDGTLIDPLGDFDVALNRMLTDLQRPGVSRADIERMVGKGSEHLIGEALKHGGLTASETKALLPRAWSRYQRHYLDINGKFASTYPGVLQGLDALRAKGLPLACLTNKPLAFAEALLKAKGLDGYFRHVFGGDSFERKKPDPLPLIRTCEALGSPPSRTLMVGDSQNDARAARAAGCPVLLVTYGYNHGESVHSVDADGFVDSLAQLATLLA